MPDRHVDHAPGLIHPQSSQLANLLFGVMVVHDPIAESSLILGQFLGTHIVLRIAKRKIVTGAEGSIRPAIVDIDRIDHPCALRHFAGTEHAPCRFDQPLVRVSRQQGQGSRIITIRSHVGVEDDARHFAADHRQSEPASDQKQAIFCHTLTLGRIRSDVGTSESAVLRAIALEAGKKLQSVEHVNAAPRPFIRSRPARGAVRPVLLWGILAALLFVANIVHLVTRSWEASFYQTSYATIYFPTDTPTILEWHERPDGIEAELRWDKSPTGWEIFKEGEPYSTNEGPRPFFPTLADDMAWYAYTAVPQPAGMGKPIELTLRFIPTTYWDDIGLPRPDSYMIRTDTPHGRFDQYPISEWVDDYAYLEESQLAEIDRILTDEVGLEEGDGTLRVLEKLTVHFRDTLGTRCRGNPHHDDRWRDPFTIYQRMRSGEGKGYCTQHANIFKLFANRAGLLTRSVVGARTKGNNFIYSGHSWVEAWVPEQGRWAWVEPSFAVAYATNPKGELVNSVDLLTLRRNGTWEGVTGRTYKDWQWTHLEGEPNTFVDAPFPIVGDVVERQFLTSAIFKWRRPPNVEDLRSDYTLLFKNWDFFWGNLERYYFKPPLAYANYPTEGNRTYWERHLLLWSFLGSLIASLICWWRGRRAQR